MSNTMKVIRERLTRLKGLMDQIPEDEDCSFHEKLELEMDITENVAGQFVKLAAETDHKWQAIEEELSILRKAVANIARGVGSSKPKVLELKPFAGTRSSKDVENILQDTKYYFSVAKIYVDD